MAQWRIPRDEGEQLGASHGALVYKASVEGKERAIKRINTELYQTDFKKELDILRKPGMCDSPYLVKYYSHEKEDSFV